MAFGFPAYFSESRAYPYRQHELVMVLKSAFDELVWNYKELPNYHFIAKIPTNTRSWGEIFKVEIFQNGYVTTESKCVYPTQCFDWGKNKQNVTEFFFKFESLLKRELVNEILLHRQL